MRAFCLLWQNFGKWIQASRYGFVFIKKWIDSRINSRLDADNTFAGFCFVKLRENLFLNLPKSRVPTPIFNRLNEVVIAFSESIGIWLVPSLASLGVTSILRAINRFDWTISRGEDMEKHDNKRAFR